MIIESLQKVSKIMWPNFGQPNIIRQTFTEETTNFDML